MALDPRTEARLYPVPQEGTRGHKTITGPGNEKHEIYYEEYGNPIGEPVFVLHGGPGYGTSSFYARYFDPQFYHIILFDQRNAKRSTPSALDASVLKTNTSEQMMEDINRLAESFGVDFSGKDPAKHHKIHLWGGSWGSVLGLYYAAHYPERLHSLSIRAVTLGVADELNKLHELDANGEPRLKAQVGLEQWKRCEAEWNKFIGFVRDHAPPAKLKESVGGAYHYLLTSPGVPEDIQLMAAHRFVMLEHVAGDQVHTPEEVEADVNASMTPKQQLAYARIESNWEHNINLGTPGFYAKKGDPRFNFFTDGRIGGMFGKKPMDQIAKVPIVRVAHGMKDNVCFMQETDVLERELSTAMQRRGIRGEALARALRVERPPEAGHMIDDPGITHSMVGFTDEIRDIRQKETRVNAGRDETQRS